MLKRYEEMVASEHVSTLVIDREGMSTDFLRRLTQDGRTIITILRSDQYTGLETFSTVGDFLPLQTDAQGRVIREVAPAQFQHQRLAPATGIGLQSRVRQDRSYQF